MITIVTYFWGKKYGVEYIDRLAAGIRANMRGPYRFLVVTDQPMRLANIHEHVLIPEVDRHLTQVKGCFARLRLFDIAYQQALSLTRQDRVVCIDLDVVVTGRLDPLFDRLEDFVILQGANSSNPCPYNGSLWMMRPWTNQKVWKDFSVEAASKIKYDSFPDDQGWFWHTMPKAAGWEVGRLSGIYAFQKPRWPGGDQLPTDARIVAFPGSRDPSQFTKLEWVRRHWLRLTKRADGEDFS